MIRNFSVPEPCREQWDGMKPQESGRFCGSCQKVVIDFTNKTEQEIIDHIAANAGKKMCGTFKSDQLSKANPEIEFQKNERIVKFLAALLLVFGMTLFSCHSIAFEKGTADVKQEQESHNIMGDIIIPTPDSLESISAGDSLAKVIPPLVKEKTGVCNTITGLIIPEIIDPEVPIIIEPETGLDSIRIHDPIIGMISYPMPEFPGGESEMRKYISENLKYPKIAIDSFIHGTVYVAFIVKADGSINDVKILRGISSECDAEAIKVVKEMPKWKPGQNNGQAVDVKYNLPIKFTLR